MSARRVLYVQFTNPAGYPPLLHSSALVAEHGCEVQFLGIALGKALTLPPNARISAHLLPAQPPGWRQKVAYLGFLFWMAVYVLRDRPVCVYASDPLSAPAGLLAKWLGCRVVYHEHDTPAEAQAHHQASWFMRRILAARAALGRRADLCVLPNARRAETFSAVTGRREIAVVWNCPRRDEAACASESSPAADGLKLVFHGSIVPARQLEPVIEAMRSLPADVSLLIIGYETAGHPGYLETLATRAHAAGVADRVTFAGPIPRGELLQKVASCDVGLALFPITATHADEADMVGASNKPFEYLACGLPLLISDVDQWRDAFAARGLAVTCQPDSPSSVTRAIQFFRDHPAERRAMGERGRQMIRSTWNYETQFAPVLRAMLEPAS